MGQYFLLLRTTCEGEIVFVLMGLLLPGVSISCRCLRHVRVRLFCIPGVAFTGFLFRVAGHLCTCIVSVGLVFCFLLGLLFQWREESGGWHRARGGNNLHLLLCFVS